MLIAISITAYTLLVYIICLSFLKTTLKKIFFFSGIWGTWLVCGIGASYPGTPIEYIYYYCIFLIVLAISFVLSLKHLSRLSIKVAMLSHYNAFSIISNKHNIRLILLLYLSLSIFPLIYPEFRLIRLFDPPRLDISFFTGVPIDRTFFEKLITYCQLLLFPIYLVSLHFFRKNILLLCLIISFPIYTKYCATGYVGRGGILIWILIIGTSYYVQYRRKRRTIVAVGLLSLPAVLFLFFAMGHIRSGNDHLVTKSNFIEGLQSVLFVQTNFPYYSKYIIFSETRANPVEYFKWLITTPIPKVVTGSIDGSRINFEIAYLIRGLSPGDPGFTVDLTGVVSESIYIFGNHLFWIHALFIAILFAFLCSLMEGLPRPLLFAAIYIAIYWGYVLNRAGIASAWPQIINGFLSLYFLIAWKYFNRNSIRRNNYYENSNVFSRKASTSPASHNSGN